MAERGIGVVAIARDGDTIVVIIRRKRQSWLGSEVPERGPPTQGRPAHAFKAMEDASGDRQVIAAVGKENVAVDDSAQRGFSGRGSEWLGMYDVVRLAGLKRPLHFDGDHAGHHDGGELHDGLVQRLSDGCKRVVRLDVVAVVESNRPNVVTAL